MIQQQVAAFIGDLRGHYDRFPGGNGAADYIVIAFRPGGGDTADTEAFDNDTVFSLQHKFKEIGLQSRHQFDEPHIRVQPFTEDGMV